MLTTLEIKVYIICVTFANTIIYYIVITFHRK